MQIGRARRRDRRGRRKSGNHEFRRAAECDLRRQGRVSAIICSIFLHLDGEDLRKLPLRERKARAEEAARAQRRLQRLALFQRHRGARPRTRSRRPAKHKLEGIISKRARRHLSVGPHHKLAEKQMRHGAGIRIIGWRPSKKGGRPFSSILLGYARERATAICRAGSAAATPSTARRPCGKIPALRTRHAAG